MLDAHKDEVWESSLIQVVVEREETVTSSPGMRADEKVSQNTAGAGGALFSPTSSVPVEGTAGGAPDCLIQVPVNENSGIEEERVKKRLGAAGSRHQLCKDKSSDR
jgi:hypothetical protein